MLPKARENHAANVQRGQAEQRPHEAAAQHFNARVAHSASVVESQPVTRSTAAHGSRAEIIRPVSLCSPKVGWSRAGHFGSVTSSKVFGWNKTPTLRSFPSRP